MSEPTPGIYRDVPSHVYHGWPFLSAHRLAWIERSPKHFKAKMERPDKQTPAMARGEAVHVACLQPDLFPQRYIVSPKFDRRTKEGKAGAAEFEKANAGKVVIEAEEHDQYQAMSAAVWSHLTAGKLLKGKIDVEISGVFDLSDTRCQLRSDFINHTIGAVCDLKTCEDASPEAFEGSVGKFNYHRQAAFYLDGWKALGHEFKRFILIAVESEPPHEVAVYNLNLDAIDAGRKVNNTLLNIYRNCKAKDEWLGYPATVQDIGIPAWLQRRIDNTYL